MKLVRKGWRKRGQMVLGAAVSALSLWLVLRGVDWPALGDSLAQVRPIWLLGAVAFEMGSILVNAARWQCLFWPQGRPGLKRLYGVLTVAQLANGVLPGRLGLVARTLLGGGKDLTRATVAGTLLVEKVLEGVTLLMLGAGLSLAVDLPGWVRGSAVVSGLLLLGLLLVLVLGLRVRERILDWVSRWSPAWGLGLARSLLDGIEALRSTKMAWRLWLWSVIYWGVVGGVIWLVLKAMSLAVPITATLLLLFVLQVGVRLPASPGHIGVLEYLGVLCLGLFGVGKEQALGCSLVLHLVFFLPPSLVGALYLLWLGGGLDPLRRAAGEVRES